MGAGGARFRRGRRAIRSRESWLGTNGGAHELVVNRQADSVGEATREARIDQFVDRST